MRFENRSPSRLSNSDERSEEHTSELLSHHDLVCRLLLEKKTRACKATPPSGGETPRRRLGQPPHRSSPSSPPRAPRRRPPVQVSAPVRSARGDPGHRPAT